MIKTIVITGSTKGIGLGLAQQFLKHGHHVVVSGRRQDSVDQVVASLTAAKYQARVIGIACDVSDIAQVENLWRQSAKVFGRIDVWINNAGLINKYRNVGQLDPADIVNVVETNLSGMMNGTKVAAKAMEAQEIKDGVRGAIYNFEGFGSDGLVRAGMSVYGSTKRALRYFTKAAVKELKPKNILVGYIQPGIVVTEMGLGEAWGQPAEDIKKKKKFVMMFGDPVEPVVTFIAAKVLTNVKSGFRINWLSLPKLLWRIVSFRFTKRDPIAAAGLG